MNSAPPSGPDAGTVRSVVPTDPASLLRPELEKMRRSFVAAGSGRSLVERQRLLDTLETTVLEHKNDLARSLEEDFGSRSHHETMCAEILPIVSAVRHARAHLANWMAAEPRSLSFVFFPAQARVVRQPLGVVGVISPWNYPLNLSLIPLANALAAGNRVMLKPSEHTPRTAERLAELLHKAFAPEDVQVVLGDKSIGEAFSKLPFDHLVFIGSTEVGRHVMRAAADNLTPVTLELGGKSPCIVGDDFPIREAAYRIMAGKLYNAGQTCVAPDYALVPESKKAAFVEAAQDAVRRLYPTLDKNPDYTSIAHDGHFERLTRLVADARAKGASCVEVNPASETLTKRKFAPTLVLNPTDAMTVMQEEIFGPILPVVLYRGLSEAIAYVNARPRPLGLYFFSHREDDVERVVSETVSGGVTINETELHSIQEDLPFGGVGASGMGEYHGEEGFRAFTKTKPVFHQARLNVTRLLRPPYKKALDLALAWMLGSK